MTLFHVFKKKGLFQRPILDGLVVMISACQLNNSSAGDQGSIPCQGVLFVFRFLFLPSRTIVQESNYASFLFILTPQKKRPSPRRVLISLAPFSRWSFQGSQVEFLYLAPRLDGTTRVDVIANMNHLASETPVSILYVYITQAPTAPHTLTPDALFYADI